MHLLKNYSLALHRARSLKPIFFPRGAQIANSFCWHELCAVVNTGQCKEKQLRTDLPLRGGCPESSFDADDCNTMEYLEYVSMSQYRLLHLDHQQKAASFLLVAFGRLRTALSLGS